MNGYVNRVINYAFRAVALNEHDKEYIRSGYSSENKQELIQVATQKKVLPVVGKMMIGLNVDNDFWGNHYNHFHNRNISVIGVVDNIFYELHRCGINNIFAYENFGALLKSDTDIALYSSGDVDLFADKSNKEAITQIMRNLGYVPTEDANHERDIMTEYLKPDGIIRINIDWIILRRHLLPIETDWHHYINWNTLSCYKDTSIKLPSATVLLYLCLLRIAVHGYSRSPDVRLFIDINNAALCDPDWSTAYDYSKRDHTEVKFLTAALIAHRLNGIKVPEAILSSAQNNKYVMRIMSICYDDEAASLKYDPSGLKLLKLEAASDNRSALVEVIHMLFPPRKWLMRFYREKNGSLFSAYTNYYKRLVI